MTTTTTDWRERFASARRGVAFGHPVRILSVARTGVRCRFPDGHVERVHPEDLAIASDPERKVQA
ncbi:hypothetical protein FXB39_00600 [Nocardioides sp. BGMRC 2183]|nr:hypothetical protein FXB39_00600 [Nocardioides sp. BGMRC 2183]